MKKIILSIVLLLAVYVTQAQVGIGTASPAASSQLEVTSTTKGFLPPRMTTAQRDAISTPATGLQIYNTDNKAIETFTGNTGEWLTVGQGKGAIASNTAIGVSALSSNTTGSANTAIGYGADVATGALTNATAIGNGASVAASNTIQLGNTSVTNVKTSGTVTVGAVTYPKTDGTAGQVLTTNGSGTPTWTTPSSTGNHYLGEEYLGGIVFNLYTTSDGMQHGLLVSKTETTATYNGTSLVGADRTEDGAYNTNLMPTGAGTANNWVVGLGLGWYLPSMDELSLLWHSRYYVNKTARAISSTLLSTAGYWSSTETSASNAFYFYFYNGATDANGKTTTHSVRGVRAF